jgi:DNA-binding transcriptional regulator YhcF (GntR family)
MRRGGKRGKTMNEMKIRISLYFEIKDSEMFGGEGSVGYTEQNIGFTVTEEKPRIFEESAYDYVKRAIANMAKSLGVSEECIRIISKEEYEENTED